MYWKNYITMIHNLRNKFLLAKEAVFGKNWDWVSLQMMEYRKICEMLNCCKENGSIYADSQNVIRDLSICKKILEIILEIDFNEDLLVNKSKKLNINLNYGTILTADVFTVYANIDHILNKIPKHLNILANEMEAFGLFHVANLCNKNATCLISIVDSILNVYSLNTY